MSDPYLPPNPQSPYVPGRENPNAAKPSGGGTGEVHNTTIRGGSGASTGVMVALVFVVIAALAYAFYDPAGTPAPADGTTGEQTDGNVTTDPVAPAATDTEVAPPADGTGTAPADPALPAPAPDAAPAEPAPAAPANP